MMTGSGDAASGIVHSGGFMKTRRRAASMAWPALIALSATFASMLAICMFNGTRAASAVTNQLRYRAIHSVFGDIGTYTNRIERDGDATVIRTTVHLDVHVLGVVLHREDAERVERWRGNMLREFHGTTTVNGVATAVDGKADGNAFVIDSPRGRIMAPATIRPSNPWSSDFLGTSMMMLTDTGEIEPVRVTGGEPASVNIEG